MSYPVFQVPAGDVLPVMFASYAGSTGASVTLTGLAVTDIEIYKDGSTTQRASDAGYTLLDTDGIDFDGITGIHGFSIDTGDNTDASFYTVGAWFTVVVSAVTVDSQTVNFIACQFRLMPAESVAGKPKVDTDTFGGTAGTFSSGRPEVNTTHLAGTAYATQRDSLVDLIWDEVLNAAAHNVAGSAGRRLRQLGAASITGGTAQAGASNSITLAAGESATNEIYDNNLIVIVGGTGAGQSRVIVEYNGTSKVATVDQVWVTTPDNTSEYEILADHQSDISHHGLAQAGAATTITLSSTASATDDVYVGSTIYLSTSTGSGQARLITDYDGTTKVATVSPAWVTNPGANSVYKILPIGRAIVDSGTVTTVSGNVNGSVGSVTGAVGSVTGAVGSVTGLTASDVAAIKAKTDSLAFTVAGQVDANVQYVNDVAVTGTGASGSEWGPA